MKFQVSQHSDDNYGWSWVSEKMLTPGDQYIPNEEMRDNLKRLSHFLVKIPFPYKIASGYRSPSFNASIGGAADSQHMNGLSVDIVPTGMRNWMLGAWIYYNRWAFPEIDQVITYTDTPHLHIGICRKGATGCGSGAPNKVFLVSTRGEYRPWIPTPLDLPMDILNADPRVVRSWLPKAAVIGSVAAVVAAWYYRDRLRKLL
jgi:hypothetical protein